MLGAPRPVRAFFVQSAVTLGEPVNTDLVRREEFGRTFGDRRLWRIETTREIKLWQGFRRRQQAVRGGVLISFFLAMVIYPIMGTITPATDTVRSVQGVTIGEAPETIEVVLGLSPQLEPKALRAPSEDDRARALAANADYIVSNYLPDCDGSTEWSGTNGNLSPDSLCTLWDGKEQLRSDAAVALAALNAQYKKKFGKNICLYDSYRTLDEQYAVKRKRGYKAARPGTSYHGWGLAVDLCDYRGATWEWMWENAGAYGWENPEFARTSVYEPWHWEYFPGTHLVGWQVDGYWSSDIADGSAGSGDTDPDTVTPEDNPDPEASP